MPAWIIAILQLLGGLGGAFAGGRAASAVATSIGKLLGSAGARVGGTALPGALSKLGTVGTLGRGAASVTGDVGGFVTGSAVTEGLLSPLASEPPRDPTLDDIMPSGSPYAREHAAGMKRLYDEAQIRSVLEQLGVDPDEFLMMAQPRSGLV